MGIQHLIYVAFMSGLFGFFGLLALFAFSCVGGMTYTAVKSDKK